MSTRTVLTTLGHKWLYKMPVAIQKRKEKRKMTQRTFEEQQKITMETLVRCDYGTLMDFYEKTNELHQDNPEGVRHSHRAGH